MALSVHLAQSGQRPVAAGEPIIPVPLWVPVGPTIVLGESRDDQGFPLPVVPSPKTLFGPRGCCLASNDGPLWVADTGHHRLLGWRACPTASDVEADWVIGQPDFLSEGRNAKRHPGPTTLNVPTGIAAYGDGLAVADAWNHRVLIWRQLPSASHCPPDLVLGQKNFGEAEINRGCTAPSAETLYWPYGVFGWGDSLIVADTGNRRVLIWFTPPTENGQAADLVLGQTDFAGKDENAGGAASAKSMRWPHGIARWGNKLCVADAGNNRVMIWSALPSDCGAESDWILGQRNASQVDHNGGEYWPHAGSLNMPYGIASGGDWLVVSDTANSRLLGWHAHDLETGAPARALAGQRSFDRKGDNQWVFPTPDTICWPYGVSVFERTLVIADSGNNRVVIRPMCVEESV